MDRQQVEAAYCTLKKMAKDTKKRQMIGVRILLLNFHFCLILRLYDTQYTTYLGCSSYNIGVIGTETS